MSVNTIIIMNNKSIESILKRNKIINSLSSFMDELQSNNNIIIDQYAALGAVQNVKEKKLKSQRTRVCTLVVNLYLYNWL